MYPRRGARRLFEQCGSNRRGGHGGGFGAQDARAEADGLPAFGVEERFFFGGPPTFRSDGYFDGRQFVSGGGQCFTQRKAEGGGALLFGEQKAQFAVPEFEGPVRGKVTVAINGHKRSFPQQIKAGKKWTFFVVPNEHLDVGYTDYQAKVAEVHARVIDEAMALIKEHPAFRFSVDGFWEIEHFLDPRTPADNAKL